MKFIDFFAGIGGFRRGMELAGHECVGFCEFDKFATASYTSMHLITEFQRKQLESLSIKQRQKEILKEEYRNGEWYANDIRRVYAGDVPKADCWCFGFPCQDISVAGKQLGFQGNRSSLFFRVMYLIGHLRGRSTSEVFPVEGTNGENSISIIGHRDGYRRNTQVFAPEGITEVLDTGQGGGRGHHVGIPCFVDLSYKKSKLTDAARCLQARYNKGPSNRKAETSGVAIKIIGEINSSQDGQIHSIDGIAKCHSAGHNNSPKVAIPVLTPDRAKKRQNGRRFKGNGEPMFTLTGQDRHGVAMGVVQIECSENENGIYVQFSNGVVCYAVWYEKYQCYIAIRKLTPKECFRLQGWTDDYFEKAAFVNSDSQLYKQAGNGVTVNVIYEIAKRLKECDND